MVRERERLIGMTAEERAWRAQFLKDQHLAPNEPVHVSAYWKERYNPIRRFYRAPLDAVWKALTPSLVNSN
jgi:NADH dehydrogenase (ubiquinone) 1 beta subcomplex subunit 6